MTIPPSKIPQDESSEACLLGALLIGLDPDAKRAVCRRVAVEDFYDSADGGKGAHGVMYASIKARIDAGKPVDGALIRSDLVDGGFYDMLWGDDKFGELLQCVPHAAHLEEYANKVKAKSDARRALSVTEDTTRRLLGCGDDPYEVIGHNISRMSSIKTAGLRVGGRTAHDIVHDRYAALDSKETTYLTSCLPSIQDILGGYKRKKKYVLAALPSVGKSTLARQEVIAWAIAGVKCALISLEESEDLVGSKLLAAYGEVPNYRIERGDLRSEDFAKLARGVAQTATENLIFYEPAPTLEAVISCLEDAKHRHGIQVAVVDHFHLIQTKGDGDTERQTRISGMLKYKYRELDIVGITVAQLNKSQYAQDKGKRVVRPPNRGDLRGSGALDADADAVILLHREDEFHKGETLSQYMPSNIAQFIIAKNKGGRCGDTGTKVKWNGDFQRYEDSWVVDPFAPQCSVPSHRDECPF